MSKLALHHPEDGVLLRYVDGELSRRESSSVEDHLKACWECRAALNELQEAVNECVRYRKQVLIPTLPPPPSPWKSLDFAQVDAEIAAESFGSRIARWLSPLRSRPMRWALSGALAAALALVAVRQLRETPKVEAAALLHKAIDISDARPHTAHRLRVLSSRGPILRTAAALKRGGAEVEVRRLFETAGYDWNDPLSARAYAAWHDALARKVDEVSTADPAVYDIKTTTQDSELLSATLKLRRTDLAPLEGRFEFRSKDWVEISESVDQLDTPASTIAGTTGGTPRQPVVPPATSLHEAAEVPAVNAELQVAEALHQVGADLGDPLEITREGNSVVVTGAGIPPARQQQIHDQLDRLPQVVVRFSDPVFPASTPAAEPATTRDAAVPPDRSTYTARIEQRLGGRPQFERFSGQLFDWTDSAMSRAYALRRLGQQFPPSTESGLTASERRTLHTIGREHIAALQGYLGKIQSTVAPVLQGIGGAAGTREQGAPAADWQTASEQMLSSARHVEKLLAVVLGATSGNPAEAPSQLLTALSQLTLDIQQCQRLLSYD